MTTALDILRSGHLTRNEGLPTHTVRTTPDRARERSGFEPWPGTLCCVLWQDSHGASLHPRCINGYRRIYCWEIYLHAMDQHPTRRGEEKPRFMIQKLNLDKFRLDGPLGS